MCVLSDRLLATTEWNIWNRLSSPNWFMSLVQSPTLLTRQILLTGFVVRFERNRFAKSPAVLLIHYPSLYQLLVHVLQITEKKVNSQENRIFDYHTSLQTFFSVGIHTVVDIAKKDIITTTWVKQAFRASTLSIMFFTKNI